MYASRAQRGPSIRSSVSLNAPRLQARCGCTCVHRSISERSGVKIAPELAGTVGAVNRASTVPTAPLTPPADEAEQSISCCRKALLIMKMPPTFRPWSSQLTYQSKSGLATPPRQHVPPTRGQYRLHICQLRQHTSRSSPCDAVRLSPHCASKAL